MPRSQQPEDGEKLVLDAILSNPLAKVLDVGCGDGKWSILTGKVSICHGIEAWQNYVIKFDLEEKYDELFILDVKEFDEFENYDIVILGDVLEHLEYKDALVVVDKIKSSGATAYLIIPISLCVQDGMFYGNPYETHRYQWTHRELVDLGFKQLHEGTNPNGLVKIGTYILSK